MHFAFVILHYKTKQDTIDCIESIKKLPTTETISIVVVDNASNNGSIEDIEAAYSSDSCMYFVHNESNMGFARGNNVGYAYAKKLNPDFILILNNDIIIDSDNVLNEIVKCYNDYSFSVLGPDIVSLVDQGHQNPPAPTPLDLKILRKRISRYKLLRFLNRFHVYGLFHKLFGNKNRVVNIRDKCVDYKQNVQLHGSFLVFSRNYFVNEKYAFNPQTFLYTEEPILFDHCLKKGYITLYCPSISVFHKEDSSTNAVYKADYEKRNFVFDNLIKSYKVLYRQIKDNIEEWD